MYRVMIVEDEKIIRTGIASVVSRFGSGFEVAWQCADAYAAWDLFQAEAPDLVITDIVMRGMSGLELARKIREAGSDVPLVILSGYAEFEYARSAIQLGVCEYVVKPPGKLALVPDSDPRPAVDLDTAADEFTPLE